MNIYFSITHKKIIAHYLGRVSEDSYAGCTINCDLTKMTINITHLDLITKTTQGFKEDMKSIMNFNTSATQQKGISYKQETDTKLSYNIHKICSSGI